MNDSRMLCQVRTDCLITYNSTEYRMALSTVQKHKMMLAMKEAKKTQYGGNLTVGAKKRLTRAIDLLIQISTKKYGYNQVTKKYHSHNLSFITLTIPGDVLLTAEKGYDSLLKHFLQWLRRTKKINTYVWKAEFQKRGQLHYHITTPTWIHYQEIKDKWNSLLRSSGLLENYFKEKKHYNPNSTDIHEVKSISNLAGYLKKEFCKSIQNKQTNGKLWDCSLNLKDNKYFKMELDYKLLIKLHDDVKKGRYEKIELEQCNIYKPIEKNTTQQVLTLKQIQDYKTYIEHIKNYIRIITPKEKK